MAEPREDAKDMARKALYQSMYRVLRNDAAREWLLTRSSRYEQLLTLTDDQTMPDSLTSEKFGLSDVYDSISFSYLISPDLDTVYSLPLYKGTNSELPTAEHTAFMRDYNRDHHSVAAAATGVPARADTSKPPAATTTAAAAAAQSKSNSSSSNSSRSHASRAKPSNPLETLLVPCQKVGNMIMGIMYMKEPHFVFPIDKSAAPACIRRFVIDLEAKLPHDTHTMVMFTWYSNFQSVMEIREIDSRGRFNGIYIWFDQCAPGCTPSVILMKAHFFDVINLDGCEPCALVHRERCECENKRKKEMARRARRHAMGNNNTCNNSNHYQNPNRLLLGEASGSLAPPHDSVQDGEDADRSYGDSNCSSGTNTNSKSPAASELDHEGASNPMWSSWARRLCVKRRELSSMQVRLYNPGDRLILASNVYTRMVFSWNGFPETERIRSKFLQFVLGQYGAVFPRIAPHNRLEADSLLSLSDSESHQFPRSSSYRPLVVVNEESPINRRDGKTEENVTIDRKNNAAISLGQRSSLEELHDPSTDIIMLTAAEAVAATADRQDPRARNLIQVQHNLLNSHKNQAKVEEIDEITPHTNWQSFKLEEKGQTRDNDVTIGHPSSARVMNPSTHSRSSTGSASLEAQNQPSRSQPNLVNIQHYPEAIPPSGSVSGGKRSFGTASIDQGDGMYSSAKRMRDDHPSLNEFDLQAGPNDVGQDAAYVRSIPQESLAASTPFAAANRLARMEHSLPPFRNMASVNNRNVEENAAGISPASWGRQMQSQSYGLAVPVISKTAMSPGLFSPRTLAANMSDGRASPGLGNNNSGTNTPSGYPNNESRNNGGNMYSSGMPGMSRANRDSRAPPPESSYNPSAGSPFDSRFSDNYRQGVQSSYPLSSAGLPKPTFPGRAMDAMPTYVSGQYSQGTYPADLSRAFMYGSSSTGTVGPMLQNPKPPSGGFEPGEDPQVGGRSRAIFIGSTPLAESRSFDLYEPGMYARGGFAGANLNPPIQLASRIGRPQPSTGRPAFASLHKDTFLGSSGGPEANNRQGPPAAANIAVLNSTPTAPTRSTGLPVDPGRTAVFPNVDRNTFTSANLMSHAPAAIRDNNTKPAEQAMTSIPKSQGHSGSQGSLASPAGPLSTPAIVVPLATVSGQPSSTSVVPPPGNSRECSVCQQVFSTPSNMRQHYNLVHVNRRDHVCTTCGSSFKLRSKLSRHMRNVHKIQSTLDGSANDDEEDENASGQ